MTAEKPFTAPGLDLVQMSPEFVEAMLDGQGASGTEFARVRLWDGWTAEESPWIALRLTQLRAMPELAPWLLYAVVRRSDRQMVGHIGFHSAPGPNYLRDVAPGGIEIGYAIFRPYRGRGYATDAVKKLIEWAHEKQGVSDFVVAINRENAPSRRVAEKLGFTHFRDPDSNDPDQEDIYRLRIG